MVYGHSDFPIAPAIAVLVVAVISMGLIYGAIMARKRREALWDLARRLNLNFNPQRDFGIPGRFGFIKQLDQGDNRYAVNVLSGTYQQHEILAFDYHYETYSTDEKGNRTTQHHWFSFFILMLPAVFPDLTIRREGFFTKVATLFGYQDIQFESAEFSKTFCVRSPDKKFAYDVCHARMMEYLLAHRDVNLEIEQDVLALTFKERISAAAFECNLQRLAQIRALLPEYLLAQNT